MFKDIIISFKLLKYGYNYVSHILFFILFFFLGTSVLLTTELTFVGCTFILLSPCMLASIFYNLAQVESIGASPKHKLIGELIPNTIMCLGAILSYAIFTLTMHVKMDSTSVFYSIYTLKDATILYFAGIVSLFTVILLLPLIYKRTMLGMFLACIIADIIYLLEIAITTLLYIWFYTEFIFSFKTLAITGFVITVVGLFITFKANPFAKFGFRLKAKTGTKKVDASKQQFALLLGIGAMVCTIIIIVNSFITRQNADGLHRYNSLKDQYQDLLEDCGETIESCGFKITLEKTYFMANDGCCLLKIEAPKDANIAENINVYPNEYILLQIPDDAYSELYITVNGFGSMDAEYEIDSEQKNIAYVYMYLNYLDNSELVTIDLRDNYSFRQWEANIDWSAVTEKDLNSYTYPQFILKENGESITIDKEDCSHTITNSSILCNTTKTPTDVVISTKGRKSITVMKDGLMADGYEKIQNPSCYKIIFPETIDVSQIKDVTFKYSDKDVSAKNYISTENDYLRKTVYYKVNEDSKEIAVSIDMEWLQMPKYRKTDCIILENYSSYGMENITITQQVLQTPEDSKEEWVDTTFIESILYDYAAILNGSEDYATNVSSNTYSIDGWYNDLLYIFPTIYKDTRDYSYTKQKISINFTLTYIAGRWYDCRFEYPTILCTYYHHTTDITGNIDVSDLTKPLLSGTSGRPIQFELKTN